MGLWRSLELLKLTGESAEDGDLLESLKRFAPSGVNNRQSPSRLDLWRELESLEMRPKIPKNSSKAMLITIVMLRYYSHCTL